MKVLLEYFWEELSNFEENMEMPYITSVERIGMRKGEVTMLTRLLQRRFGDLPAWANEKLAKADPPSLEEWGLRIFDAQTLDGVFADKA